MALHKFGLIDKFDENNFDAYYNFKELECIEVDNELIVDMSKYLINLRCYHKGYSEVQKGLNYKGVTLIPVSSLLFFHDIVSSYNRFKKSEKLKELTCLIMEGKIKGKYIMHFGV